MALSAALESYLQRIINGSPDASAGETASFHGLALASRYQPIFDMAGQRAVGYEGLLVAATLEGTPVSPAHAFALAADDAEAVYLDWLARALHMRNFRRLGDDTGRLYVNVSPAAAVEDPHFRCVFANLMESCGVDPHRIVVEILESGVANEDRLVEAVALYRSLGCSVALDDFGAGAAAMERVWKLQPDIVKLDRSMVRAAARSAHALRVLRSMVHMVHDCGAKVVLEGVESEEEARLAVDTSAEYVQGYWFARPASGRADEEAAARVFATLVPPSEQAFGLGVHGLRADALQAAAMALETGGSFVAAVDLMLDAAGAVRAYLISADGQVLDSRACEKGIERSGSRRQHLAAMRACNRVLRLVREAVAQPGVARYTRSAGAGPAGYLTFAFAFLYRGSTVAVCADFPAG